jgi:predicted transposase/invertase (TIGR01784 family)
MSEIPPSQPHNPDDKLFKAIFKTSAHVKEVMESAASGRLLRLLNLDTLRITDSSFVDEKLAENMADVVLECQTQASDPTLVCFILEHKSYVPAYPNFQVMHYQDQVWSYQTGNPKTEPSPVVPVLFYHGSVKWKKRSWRQHLKGWDRAFKPFTPKGSYVLIDLSSMPDKAIKRFRSGFLVTALLLMKHRLEREFLLKNVMDIVNFVESEEGIDEDIRIDNLQKILRYLQGLRNVKWNEIVHKLQPLTKTNEVMTVLEEIKTEAYVEGKQDGIEVGRKEGIAKGMEKGMEKGIEKGIEYEAYAIIRSIIEHMPNASDETIANLTSKPKTLVAAVRKSMKKTAKPKSPNGQKKKKS